LIYVIGVIAAVVTGGLFALGSRLMLGIEHTGILAAIGVMGAGLQTIVLMAWYLFSTRPRESPVLAEPLAPARD
jgi:hypothetical protein